MKRLAAGTSALALAALFVAMPARAQQRPPAPAAGQQDARPGMAVLDFDIGATIGQDPDDYQALRRGLASMTIGEIAVNPAVRVVERAQLQQILQEQNLGREGRVEANTIVQIGRLIGARYMVTGTLYDVRGSFRIDARLFDAETGQILRTQRVTGRLDNVFELVSQLATQLMRDANLPPLERRVQEERQRQGNPPTQAVMAYSRAVLYADRGDTNRAVEQYRAALTAFPNYTQARADCNRLQQGACA
ncbi:MAG: CsgG/HfaB family protein [Gemmatimonadales bacterium]|nr:CsgG/HfaB family protein [Gemmatimonadales bacterium]